MIRPAFARYDEPGRRWVHSWHRGRLEGDTSLVSYWDKIDVASKPRSWNELTPRQRAVLKAMSELANGGKRI